MPTHFFPPQTNGHSGETHSALDHLATTFMCPGYKNRFIKGSILQRMTFSFFPFDHKACYIYIVKAQNACSPYSQTMTLDVKHWKHWTFRRNPKWPERTHTNPTQIDPNRVVGGIKHGTSLLCVLIITFTILFV